MTTPAQPPTNPPQAQPPQPTAPVVPPPSPIHPDWLKPPPVPVVPPPLPQDPPKPKAEDVDELAQARAALKAEQDRVAALTQQYNQVATYTLQQLPEADRGLIIALAGDDVAKQLDVMQRLREAGKISTATAVPPQPPQTQQQQPPQPQPPTDQTRISGLDQPPPPKPTSERGYTNAFVRAAVEAANASNK